jgi:hypothetical protein
MLRIERQNKHFTRLDEPNLAAVSITERYDLQEFIFNSPEQFFAEVAEELFVIGKETRPSEVIQDRIDLLALDPEGNAVIIELKRGNDKLQLLQAVAYAGMVAKWRASDLLGLLDADRQEKLADFLNVDTQEINREQRIILIAEAYDFEVLVGAEWLHNNYELDILCCRIALSTDRISGTEYLACTPVFPAPELAMQAVTRRRSVTSDVRWTDWENALADISNSAIANYYNSELKLGRESYLRKRLLIYRVNGKRRWSLAARDNRAYCWQAGRFKGDVDFWSTRLLSNPNPEPVKSGKALRFFVSTAEDFAEFRRAVGQELLGVEWREQSPMDDTTGQDVEQLVR